MQHEGFLLRATSVGAIVTAVLLQSVAATASPVPSTSGATVAANPAPRRTTATIAVSTGLNIDKHVAARAPKHPAQTLLDIGIAATTSTLQTLAGSDALSGWGPQLTIGRQYSDFSVLAMVGVLDMRRRSGEIVQRADAMRAGVAARMTVFEPDPRNSVHIAIELSAERRFIRWNRGGNLQRDLILGGLVVNGMLPIPGVRIGAQYAIRMGGASAPLGVSAPGFAVAFEVAMHLAK